MFDHSLSTCGDWNTSLVEEETLSECLKGQEGWTGTPFSFGWTSGPLRGFTLLHTALPFCVLTSSQGGQETLGALFFSWFVISLSCFHPDTCSTFNQYLGWLSQLPHNHRKISQNDLQYFKSMNVIMHACLQYPIQHEWFQWCISHKWMMNAQHDITCIPYISLRIR